MRETLVRLAARNWPFANGSGRVIDKFGAAIDLGHGERVARTSDEFDITVLADDHIGRHILISGKFDRSPIQVLLDFCEPGDHCIDIGANIGYVACVILQRVPGSTIVCVEPQPGVASVLATNLARFPKDRWTLMQIGLSDSETSGFLELNTVNRGASRLVTGQSSTTVSVPLRPAGSVLGALDRLDIMKMDIEGHEEAVFRSGAEALARLQPRAILFEDQKGEAAPDGAIGKLLTKAGYRIFGIDKALFTTTLSAVTAHDASRFNDFIAVSNTRALPAKALALYNLR